MRRKPCDCRDEKEGRVAIGIESFVEACVKYNLKPRGVRGLVAELSEVDSDFVWDVDQIGGFINSAKRPGNKTGLMAKSAFAKQQVFLLGGAVSTLDAKQEGSYLKPVRSMSADEWRTELARHRNVCPFRINEVDGALKAALSNKRQELVKNEMFLKYQEKLVELKKKGREYLDATRVSIRIGGKVCAILPAPLEEKE